MMIGSFGPIGRRNLSIKSHVSERQVRNDCDLFRDNGLIEFKPEGMIVTQGGEQVLKSLRERVHDYNGFAEAEALARKKLGIKKVLIVDSLDDQDEKIVLKPLGIEAAYHFNEILSQGDVVGLTGGTSVFSFVENYVLAKNLPSDLLVVPARGGLGRITEYQANTLAERLSAKLGAAYGPLFMPDALSQASIDFLKEEPDFKRAINDIARINLLVFGIGKADVMALRRDLSSNEREKILSKGAVAEAFGYYFSDNGEIVHEISTIGITLNQFKQLERLIAIAAGPDKAKAIQSISRINKNLVLVTDIACAREIINS
jgi:central glycolytic genes regulator